jgi:hypothetical protein
MSNAPARATVKHADDYTTEDLNADVDAFRLALVQYVRARRSTDAGQADPDGSCVMRSEPPPKIRDG